MKKFFVILTIMAIGLVAGLNQTLAQTNAIKADISMNMVVTDKYTAFPWVNISYGRLLLDTRFNFNSPHALELLTGWEFGKTEFKVIPEIGIVAGKNYQGLTTGFYISSEELTYSYINLLQYSLGAPGNNNFYSQWCEVYAKTILPIMEFGLSNTVLYNCDGEKTIWHLGPIIKATMDEWYIKIWYTTGPQPPKNEVCLSLGYKY
jgi:hypothetical protein